MNFHDFSKDSIGVKFPVRKITDEYWVRSIWYRAPKIQGTKARKPATIINGLFMPNPAKNRTIPPTRKTANFLSNQQLKFARNIAMWSMKYWINVLKSRSRGFPPRSSINLLSNRPNGQRNNAKVSTNPSKAKGQNIAVKNIVIKTPIILVTGADNNQNQLFGSFTPIKEKFRLFQIIPIRPPLKIMQVH
ncbi:hypothetical protein HY989_00445 [Candidatus Micrarchaeota archaeon]|nr:hypothetical protein [Candidatus Micrarchaeota archaeon]